MYEFYKSWVRFTLKGNRGDAVNVVDVITLSNIKVQNPSLLLFISRVQNFAIILFQIYFIRVLSA